MPTAPSASPPRGRRGAKGELTRERIVAAAWELVAERGLLTTSLTAVAERAGITQAGLLHHFPSKDALILAVVDRRNAIESEGLDSRIDPAVGAEVLDELMRIQRGNAVDVEMTRAFAVLVGETTSTAHPARDWMTDRYRDARRRVRASLARGVAAGTVRADVDGSMLAAEILAVMDGIQLQWLLDPESIDMVAAFDAYCARIRPTFVVG